METLQREHWLERAEAHARRVDRFVEPHLARRRAGVKHPVHDFMFGYYSHRPAELRRWHPGYGVALADAPEYAEAKAYLSTGTSATASILPAHRALLPGLRSLLAATHGRPPTLGCFGLHEWAMVHRTPEPRHAVPLRLGGAGTDEVVETHRISCSHFDAFRFFTPSARGLNALQPGRDDRADFEQPGCLHAGMDLYKHAFRLSPLIPSDLVADCFELAWEIRVLDMRAAPYDMTGTVLDPTGEPWTPVRIETSEGKAEYARLQRSFAERGAPLRQQLIEWCERLLRGAN